ncbi:MAG: PAS-domain containing protein [Candidatus Competibacteraceae bacterium]|jgi:PAS domain S-box-containing protein|nr:PAS-domain containing protein [Candidatus Competibacteraceae bacterium]
MSEQERTPTSETGELAMTERWSLTLSALEHLEQGYTIFDRQLRLVAWNQRFLELLGFPPELVRVGTPFGALISYNVGRGEYGPGDAQVQLAERLKLAEFFKPHRFERTRPDGTVLEICGNPIAEGGFITLYTDITLRKQAEIELQDSRSRLETRVAERTAELKTLNTQLAAEVASHKQTAAALRDSENWIRSIADAVPALIAYVDSALRYGFANKKHQDWFGVAPTAMIGRPFQEIVGDILYAQLQDHVQAALQGTEGSVEYQITTVAGGTLEVCSSFIPHYSDHGQVLGFFMLGQDMTEYQHAQRALNRVQRMESIGQLTGGIAHDFNNLLTLVMGSLAFLKKHLEKDHEAMTEWLKAIQTAMNAARCGAELIRRLLAFSRQQSLKPKVLSLAWQASELVDFLRRTLGETISIETHIAEEVWNILADPNQLMNALLNLAINARDAMPTGGKLTIRGGNVTLDPDQTDLDASPGDYVLLTVTDTGVGMSPEVAEHAFEPFFSTKDPGAGTGLGLSMVYGFVKQSGGHVRIQSQPGNGTAVEIYLPRTSATAIDTMPEPKTDDGQPEGDETILLVEDDAEVRQFIHRVLDDLGYTVREAADGQAALDILAADRTIDLLLSDLVIPGRISGHDLLRVAQHRHPGIRVLGMSGYPDKAAQERALLGCRMLDKPFQQQDLARAVRGVLEQA